MSTGIEYVESHARDKITKTSIPFLKIARFAARTSARATFGYSMYTDERVGRNGDLVVIPKLETLDEFGDPIDSTAAFFRKTGLDEAEQVALLENGVMSLIGRRHLTPDEYECMRHIAKKTNTGRNLLGKYDDIVLPTKCGLLSTDAIYAHTRGNMTVEQRLRMQINDVENASISNDRKLAQGFIRAIAGNKFISGSNEISVAPISATDISA